MDVNNRLNGVSYGFLIAGYRFIIDQFFSKRSRGDVRTKWQIKEKIVEGYGHVFAPFEIKSALKMNGFTLKKLSMLIIKMEEFLIIHLRDNYLLSLKKIDVKREYMLFSKFKLVKFLVYPTKCNYLKLTNFIIDTIFFKEKFYKYIHL